MKALALKPFTLIWLALFGATCLSLFVGSSSNHMTGAIGVIVIALIKMRLILLHFMEVKDAPLVWRAIMESWLVIVGVAMVGMYMFGAA